MQSPARGRARSDREVAKGLMLWGSSIRKAHSLSRLALLPHERCGAASSPWRRPPVSRRFLLGTSPWSHCSLTSFLRYHLIIYGLSPGLFPLVGAFFDVGL
jgi:hypothetical protein